MLQIVIPPLEGFDGVKGEFVAIQEAVTLQLEHSLVALSKWESKWGKPFFTKNPLTSEETLDYIKCMTLTPNVDDEVYTRLSQTNVDAIKDYINDRHTATTFSQVPGARGSGEQVTAELIYYWMVALNIPPEYRTWHINQLITLVRVCSIKNQPPKKRSTSDIMKEHAALNAARRKKHNSRG